MSAPVTDARRLLSLAALAVGSVACGLFIWVDAFRYPLPPTVFVLTMPYLFAGSALAAVAALAIRYGAYLRSALYFAGLAVVCALI